MFVLFVIHIKWGRAIGIKCLRYSSFRGYGGVCVIFCVHFFMGDLFVWGTGGERRVVVGGVKDTNFG